MMSDFSQDKDIYYCYRLLLGRDPDEEGYRLFSRIIRESDITPSGLADIFLESEEFLSRKSTLPGVVEIPLKGYSIYARADDQDVGQHLMRGTPYEPYVESVIRDLLRPGDVFIDVGANIGYFTVLAGHLIGSNGHVYAFEPLDRNVQLIYSAIWKNKFENITVYPLAASSDARVVPMSSTPNGSNAGISPRDASRSRTRLLAQAQRIDSVLAGIERLDLMKFDIEGHEAFAWEGAKSIISRHRPCILTEFHPKCIRENTGENPEKYLDILFHYHKIVHVLRRDGARIKCSHKAEIMREWAGADSAHRMNGGMHIDLFVDTREEMR